LALYKKAVIFVSIVTFKSNRLRTAHSTQQDEIVAPDFAPGGCRRLHLGHRFGTQLAQVYHLSF
jgi:hypothetical protein